MAPGPALCGWLTEAIRERKDSSGRGLWRMNVCGRAGEGSSNLKGELGGYGFLMEVKSLRRSASPLSICSRSLQDPDGQCQGELQDWTASTGA